MLEYGFNAPLNCFGLTIGYSIPTDLLTQLKKDKPNVLLLLLLLTPSCVLYLRLYCDYSLYEYFFYTMRKLLYF